MGFSELLRKAMIDQDGYILRRVFGYCPGALVEMELRVTSELPAARCDRGIEYSRLQRLRGGTENDLVGVHVLGLLDGVGDGAGYGIRIDCQIRYVASALGRFLVGDVGRKLALDCPR